MFDTVKTIDGARPGDHDGALGDECPRDCESDSLARACDDADLAFQFEVHPLLQSVPDYHRTCIWLST